jgi:Domain of unknown function (DUF4160)
VPRISSFFGIVIRMFHNDHGFPHFHAQHADGHAKIRIDNHGFPHFHAQHADGHAKIRIDTLEAIDSSLPRRQLRFVLAWAELHQAELEENWRLGREGGTLKEIEPLR